MNRLLHRPFACALILLVLACGSGNTGPQPEGSTVPDAVVPVPVESSKAETIAAVPPPSAETAKPVSRDTSGRERGPEGRPALPEPVLRTWPDARMIQHKSLPFPHDVVLRGTGAKLGCIVDSDSSGTTATGYAGPVPVRLLLDRRCRPLRIYILDNKETPVYLEIVVNNGLVERLLKFDPASPDTFDAVTLATSSSKALISSVTATATLCHRELGGAND